jgi:hypothetical protein
MLTAFILHCGHLLAVTAIMQTISWLEQSGGVTLERVPLSAFKARIAAAAGQSDTLAQVTTWHI